MTSVREASVGRAGAGEAMAWLARWTAGDRFDNPLHPGDLGWFLRFDDAECADAILVWRADGEVVAVGLWDGPVLRVGANPALTPAAAAGLAEAVTAAAAGRAAHEQWCDAPRTGPLQPMLRRLGWELDADDPWPEMVWIGPPDASGGPGVSGGPGTVCEVAEADADDRVAVQRAAFEGSTFSVPRWRRMRESEAGARCVEVLVRTPQGRPAAAVTGWLAGPGQLALLEPVGTHPDHRGRGYGRRAVEEVCAALHKRGAGAVGVATPASNTAAVALYESAGFRTTGVHLSLHRSPGAAAG